MSRSPSPFSRSARPSAPRGARRTRWVRAVAVAGGLLIAGLGPTASVALAAPTTTVDLGSAATYAALSGASVGNTVNAPGAAFTTLHGDLGVLANAQPTGFPPGTFTGTKNVANAAVADAHADLVAAYGEVAARQDGEPLAGALAGTTVGPGLHKITGAASNTTTVTLDAGGDPDAVFVFQVGGALTTAAGSHVVLAGGAQASHVFWQVNGAGDLGANADFAGTLMVLNALAVGNQTTVNGRLLARNGALTLDANDVYSAPPVVAIDGGATDVTTDTTPTISGTTDVEGPDAVTVTIGGQTLSATPVDGAWSVTSAILANGTYPVAATVQDGAGNTSRATQQLTVDTVLPVVTLDGGPARTVADATPTISGTSDVAPGTVVRVSVGGQALTALVQSGGTWNVTPATLTDGTRTVTASVSDPAGNDGTDSQQLTTDTEAPALAIAGGATALTNDATADLAGTADVPPGTVVAVEVNDQDLTAVVEDGAWSVSAATLPDGPHRVTVRVSDAAGNASRVTQTLTVDTVAPVVTIDGGAEATTNDVQPTITGTADAAPGSTVTVSIAGRTITALVQSDGTWNATPTPVGYGTYSVIATVPDPAGNVGSEQQTLTIAADAPPGPGPMPRTLPPVDPTPPGPTPPGPTPPGPTSPGPTPPGPTPPGPTPPGPTPPGPTPPSGGGSVDVAAKATVAGSARQRVRGRSLSIGTKVTAPAGGRVVVTASGTVRITGVARAIVLSSATAKLAVGRSATLRIAPKGTTRAVAAAFRRIRTATANGKTVTATIAIRVVDAAGHVRREQRTVRLTP